jgi:hypothetical protein
MVAEADFAPLPEGAGHPFRYGSSTTPITPIYSIHSPKRDDTKRARTHGERLPLIEGTYFGAPTRCLNTLMPVGNARHCACRPAEWVPCRSSMPDSSFVGDRLPKNITDFL